MQKLIIEVRVNEYAMRDGNRHVPWTAEEIGRDAEAIRKAAMETDIPEGGTIQGYGVKFNPPGHPMAGQNARATPAWAAGFGRNVPKVDLGDPPQRVPQLAEFFLERYAARFHSFSPSGLSMSLRVFASKRTTVLVR